jgi:tryptophan synthase beta chain
MSRQARADDGKDQIIIMNLCGRGDKDLFTVAKALGMEI